MIILFIDSHYRHIKLEIINFPQLLLIIFISLLLFHSFRTSIFLQRLSTLFSLLLIIPLATLITLSSTPICTHQVLAYSLFHLLAWTLLSLS